MTKSEAQRNPRNNVWERGDREVWAERDKGMPAWARAEWKALESTTGSPFLAGAVLILMVSLFVFVFWAFCMKVHGLHAKNVSSSSMLGMFRGRAQKVFVFRGEVRDLSARICAWMPSDLVNEALVLMRHSSTHSMDRTMDFIASAAERLANFITGFTTRARSRRRKKEDDDDDMLHLRSPRQAEAEERSCHTSRIDVGMGEGDSFQKYTDLVGFVDDVADEGTADRWH